MFQESFNATKIFLQLCHFLLDVFQEVPVGPIKSKRPYMASTCCCDATQNPVVFQQTSEQAKYGMSGILKRNRKALQFSFEVNN